MMQTKASYQPRDGEQAGIQIGTAKRGERDYSATMIKKEKAKNSTQKHLAFTEIEGVSRIFGNINSNFRGGEEIVKGSQVTRSPKRKGQIGQVRDHIINSLGAEISLKDKKITPRVREERGSSFHEVLSSGSSSKGASSGSSAIRSNTSLILENDCASSSDAGNSSDFSNGNCTRHIPGSSSDIADDEEEGDGIISLGKMKWFFELNEKNQTSEINNKLARDISIVIEDSQCDDDHEIRDMISSETKKTVIDSSIIGGSDSSFSFSINDSQTKTSKASNSSLLGKRSSKKANISLEKFSQNQTKRAKPDQD